MSFKLPQLPYAYDALEPHIDAKTMEIHHSKHHNGYTNNLNNAILGTDLEKKSIEEICSISGLSGGVRNNGGGYFNHNMFWTSMSPNGGGDPRGEIASAINNSFGSFENFKTEFTKSAATRFGSADLSATMLTSDGPATMSIPTSPKTSFFAQATKAFPGPTILSTFSNFFVP